MMVEVFSGYCVKKGVVIQPVDKGFSPSQCYMSPVFSVISLDKEG